MDYIGKEAEEQRQEAQAQVRVVLEGRRSPWYFWFSIAALGCGLAWDLRIGLGIGVYLLLEQLRDVVHELRLAGARNQVDQCTFNEIAARIKSIHRKTNPDAFE